MRRNCRDPFRESARVPIHASFDHTVALQAKTIHPCPAKRLTRNARACPPFDHYGILRGRPSLDGDSQVGQLLQHLPEELDYILPITRCLHWRNQILSVGMHQVAQIIGSGLIPVFCESSNNISRGGQLPGRRRHVTRCGVKADCFCHELLHVGAAETHPVRSHFTYTVYVTYHEN